MKKTYAYVDHCRGCWPDRRGQGCRVEAVDEIVVERLARSFYPLLAHRSVPLVSTSATRDNAADVATRLAAKGSSVELEVAL